MRINKVTLTPVGADLSCTLPMYRPSVGILYPSYFDKIHYQHYECYDV